MSARESALPTDRVADAMIADLRPQAGARFVLLRGVCDAERASYAAAIITSDKAWHFRLELVAGTAQPPLVIAEENTLLPEASDLDMLTMIARLTARAAPTRATDGLTPWPPRIVRWRGPGRGGSGAT